MWQNPFQQNGRKTLLQSIIADAYRDVKKMCDINYIDNVFVVGIKSQGNSFIRNTICAALLICMLRVNIIGVILPVQLMLR